MKIDPNKLYGVPKETPENNMDEYHTQNQDELLAVCKNMMNKVSDLTTDSNVAKSVMNSHEICSYLSITPTHLYKMCRLNTIPHHKINGVKTLIFLKEEIDDWLKSNGLRSGKL